MCTVLKFARSSYYKALICVPSKLSLESESLKAEIKKIWLESKCRYGAPKIHNVFNKISLKRVQHFIKAQDIRSITVRKFRYHSDKLECHNLKNILNRNFSTTSINQKWRTDITYNHTLKDGWTYLASVMDFHSKKIIGYSYGSINYMTPNEAHERA